MHPKRRQRLIIALIITFGSTVAAALALYALSQNINLYYTPSQVLEHRIPTNAVIRIGGVVKNNSIHYSHKDVTVAFLLTDHVHDLPVRYTGVLPDLFRAGQGTIVQGKLASNGVFIAEQVLAKHSADYKPIKANYPVALR